MPISEDEFDYNRSQEPQSNMSKAELRKTHKPIMEKRRRARINHCLNEIKTLILEAMNKDPARHTKLEKADILEMAVKHLQNVQRQHLALAMATDPSILRKFKNGFDECATEIDRYMSQSDGVDTAMRQRVTSHLQKCIGGIEQVAQFNFPGFSNLPIISGSSLFSSNQAQVESSSTAGDQNNNPRIQIPQGIQLIPSRLPSGELALLVPNSSNLPYFPTAVTQNVQQRPSAFAAVIPQSAASESLVPKPLSPPLSPVSQEEVRARNPSPHGFRPVLPASQRSYSEDHQVPQISSTVSSEKQQFPQPVEVKTLKYPIHKYSDKEKRSDSPKKIVEPLCIITNQSERYKQAQMKEDSANYEENIVQRGIKRKFQEVSHQLGLLTVTQNEFYNQPSKSVVREGDASSSSSFHFPRPTHPSDSVPSDEKKNEDQPSGSKDNNAESTSDMWRPW
ncbi:protein deadpan-like [Anoplophora glabripennis]|uniref:protein deadpan-like n=1 Tax=Anoplophora glabripennis TaxID=217634 RepID=UPI0008742E1F|nr:protein deadpan-like [Anoplophora glabripennis]